MIQVSKELIGRTCRGQLTKLSKTPLAATHIGWRLGSQREKHWSETRRTFRTLVEVGYAGSSAGDPVVGKAFASLKPSAYWHPASRPRFLARVSICSFRSAL